MVQARIKLHLNLKRKQELVVTMRAPKKIWRLPRCWKPPTKNFMRPKKTGAMPSRTYLSVKGSYPPHMQFFCHLHISVINDHNV